MKKLSKINENIFDGIGKRSKGGVVRKENEVKSVDLGLPSGTIWAACNLGASSPEECGDYYAWGETEPKDNYAWETYKFGEKNGSTNKYNIYDRKTILDPEDDAAHVVLGGKWHMPTREQIRELFENTINEHSEFNGVKGRLFKSKTNGNTLFFPYSGIKYRFSVNNIGDRSYHLSASLYENSPKFSMILYSNVDNSILDKGYMCYGYSVRGVLDKK